MFLNTIRTLACTLYKTSGSLSSGNNRLHVSMLYILTFTSLIEISIYFIHILKT